MERVGHIPRSGHDPVSRNRPGCRSLSTASLMTGERTEAFWISSMTTGVSAMASRMESRILRQIMGEYSPRRGEFACKKGSAPAVDRLSVHTPVQLNQLIYSGLRAWSPTQAFWPF